MNSENISKHISTVSNEARAEMAAGRWDEVMTDVLYAACGAETPDEMDEARSIATEVAARSQTPDEVNDALRAQVDAELPRPAGGFETDDAEQEWKESQEKRFMELVDAATGN